MVDFFKQAAISCKQCKDYCERNNSYGDNAQTIQALSYLGQIVDSEIARSAEEECKQCDYKSTRIISHLESEGIKTP